MPIAFKISCIQEDILVCKAAEIRTFQSHFIQKLPANNRWIHLTVIIPKINIIRVFNRGCVGFRYIILSSLGQRTMLVNGEHMKL